jgi:hypothetical protein
MPYVIRPPVRRMWVAGVAAALAMLALVIPASSKADTLACDSPALSNPFSAFGDLDWYTQVPDGGFEAGASGWSLSSGANVVTGNESSYVGSPSDSYSLSVPAGEVAVSPGFCVDQTYPTFRFFAQKVTGGSELRVRARYYDGATMREVDLAKLGGPKYSSGKWVLTPKLNLASLIDLLTSGGRRDSLQLVFTAVSGPAGGGSWQIDDVYVDPYRR